MFILLSAYLILVVPCIESITQKGSGWEPLPKNY